ncbi:MAG TPA: MFS transporter [Flavobacteriaceae bacterium]|jgi:sugar porter (SP) family MFS transporter|nr:MFS transporter [Flavobacteriaceae bacterium]
MNYTKIITWSVIVAFGGFVFGFDTAVISGAEQEIQNLWNLSNTMIGQTVAMALYGTVLGALLGGFPSEALGRKTTLIWIAILYLVSAIGSALAPEVYSLMFFRFIGGLAVGASSVTAPMYISEISPANKRGQLTALFQLNIVIGILVAYLSNYFIGGAADGNWRFMLGIESVPAALFVLLIFFVPRSPRWLILKKGRIEEAKEVLREIDPNTVEESIALIQSNSNENSNKGGFKEFVSGKFNVPILLAFFIAFFNQLSGINAVIYYSPRIFAETGMGESAALLSSVGVGVINLIATFIGIFLIDKMGRKFLMYLCSFGYIVSLGLISLTFYTGFGAGSLLIPILVFVFIASHAVGQGAVIWVFISEIFPNQVRSYGNALGSGTHWVFAALIAATFPYVTSTLGGGFTFAIFALIMVFQFIFVWKFMPETKNKSLEELEKLLIK